jgi:hypothetical protein
MGTVPIAPADTARVRRGAENIIVVKPKVNGKAMQLAEYLTVKTSFFY